MKQHLILSFFLSSICLQLFGQGYQEPCVVTIPQEAKVIHKTSILEKVAKKPFYWICNGAEATFRAGEGTFFVEDGGKITLSYGQYQVYARGRATVVAGPRSQGVIYHEADGRINLSGGNLQSNLCAYIKFDYGQAPESPCEKHELEVINVETPNSPPQTPTTPPVVQNPPNEEVNPEKNPQETGLKTEPDYADFGDRHLIPSNATVVPPTRIPTPTQTQAQGATFWVCEEARLRHIGNKNIFYVESNAYFYLQSGSDNIIYLKPNAKIKLGPGARNQVFYTEPVELLRDESNKTRFTRLNTLDYDYSQAPNGGCKP